MKSLRRLLKSALLNRGFALSRPPGQYDLTFFKLAAAARRGLRVDVAVDAGAAVGEWAIALRRVYPAAKVVCVEPRQDALEELRSTASKLGGVIVVDKALGERAGTARFYQHGNQSSVLASANHPEDCRDEPVQVVALDEVISSANVGWPDLVKIDLQGGEVACLMGAADVLTNAQALIVECSIHPFYEGAPLLGDVVTFLKERNYRCYDFLALSHRPLDGALAQADVMFLREGHALLQDARWSSRRGWS